MKSISHVKFGNFTIRMRIFINENQVIYEVIQFTYLTVFFLTLGSFQLQGYRFDSMVMEEGPEGVK